MRDIDDIIDGSVDALRSHLMEAFEAGRALGSKEAKAKMKATLAGFLSDEEESGTNLELPTIAETREAEQSPPVEAEAPDGAKRASPGSVKPTIARLLSEAVDGLLVDNIADVTGFKWNSIRGTLWTLGKEGLAEKHNDRWFPTPRLKSEYANTLMADAVRSSGLEAVVKHSYEIEAAGSSSDQELPAASSTGGIFD